jgi:hypothetical protein
MNFPRISKVPFTEKPSWKHVISERDSLFALPRWEPVIANAPGSAFMVVVLSTAKTILGDAK